MCRTVAPLCPCGPDIPVSPWKTGSDNGLDKGRLVQQFLVSVTANKNCCETLTGPPDFPPGPSSPLSPFTSQISGQHFRAENRRAQLELQTEVDYH